MLCCSFRASPAMLIGPEYVASDSGGVLLVHCSMRTGSRVGAPICPTGSALRSDCAEVQTEVKCDLMNMSHILML
jgi:hypothetical protein